MKKSTFKWLFIAFGFIVAIVIFLMLGGCPKARGKCQHQLRDIGCAIMLYRGDHDGAYPSDIASIENGMYLPLLQCPGAEKVIGNGKISESDYIYVNWLPHLPKTKVLPDDYPIVYDSRLSNHKDRGINILLVGGSVIWDENAKWLSAFVASNCPWINLPQNMSR